MLFNLLNLISSPSSAVTIDDNPLDNRVRTRRVVILMLPSPRETVHDEEMAALFERACKWCIFLTSYISLHVSESHDASQVIRSRRAANIDNVVVASDSNRLESKRLFEPQLTLVAHSTPMQHTKGYRSRKAHRCSNYTECTTSSCTWTSGNK